MKTQYQENVQNLTLGISTSSSRNWMIKYHGFCKVLSEGHFRSFYAILENDDFLQYENKDIQYFKIIYFVCDDSETK